MSGWPASVGGALGTWRRYRNETSISKRVEKLWPVCVMHEVSAVRAVTRAESSLRDPLDVTFGEDNEKNSCLADGTEE